MTLPDQLAQHIDQPDGPRHRCILLDPRRLRCLDCTQTVLLPAPPSTTGSTSTSQPPPLHDPARCPHHPGQRVGTCGPCRAEQLEATTERPLPQPTADVAAGAAAARAALRRPRICNDADNHPKPCDCGNPGAPHA